MDDFSFVAHEAGEKYDIQIIESFETTFSDTVCKIGISKIAHAVGEIRGPDIPHDFEESE